MCNFNNFMFNKWHWTVLDLDMLFTLKDTSHLQIFWLSRHSPGLRKRTGFAMAMSHDQRHVTSWRMTGRSSWSKSQFIADFVRWMLITSFSFLLRQFSWHLKFSQSDFPLWVNEIFYVLMWHFSTRWLQVDWSWLGWRFTLISTGIQRFPQPATSLNL